MPSLSHVRAARDVPDKWVRIGLMRDSMIERERETGACTYDDLRADGFSSAEIAAYRDPVLELITKRPYALGTLPDGRAIANALVFKAREQRRRREHRAWSTPVVSALSWAPPSVEVSR